MTSASITQASTAVTVVTIAMPTAMATSEPVSIVEFDPRARTLAREQWRYTTRPEWSSAGESLWMRLSKFSHCNRMSVVELARLFARQDDRAALTGIDLRCMAAWMSEAIASLLEISAEHVQASFCCAEPHVLTMRACTELRYCVCCLQAGFHTGWFQWLIVERCPLHDAPLRTGCVRCAAAIPYALGAQLALSPLRCTTCECNWVPTLVGPGGRCSPLTNREAVLMRRWADCANDFVSIAGPIGRDRRTGQFVGAGSSATGNSAARPHVLTMFNRLFDDPPPTLREMAADARRQIHLAPDQAAAIVGAADDQALGYNLRDWPHFAHGFVTYERLVRAARSHLFASRARELDRGRWHRLLVDDLVVPTTAIDSAAAAALGWAISWLSPSQALAPETGFCTPAFGLAAWLARIPLQPLNMPLQTWRLRVAQWLLDDLALSARLWVRMTTFMSTRRHYLLYGDAVSPKALAIHRAEGNL